jgi:hypothetical protein
MVTTLRTQPLTWRPKRTVLIVATLFSVASGALSVLPPQNSPQYLIFNFGGAVIIMLMVFAWCYFDSLERRSSLPTGLRILILFFGLLALFIYLFKSRGLKQGLRSSGGALLCLLGWLSLELASGAVSSLIFRQN